MIKTNTAHLETIIQDQCRTQGEQKSEEEEKKNMRKNYRGLMSWKAVCFSDNDFFKANWTSTGLYLYLKVVLVKKVDVDRVDQVDVDNVDGSGRGEKWGSR